MEITPREYVPDAFLFPGDAYVLGVATVLLALIPIMAPRALLTRGSRKYTRWMPITILVLFGCAPLTAIAAASAFIHASSTHAETGDRPVSYSAKPGERQWTYGLKEVRPAAAKMGLDVRSMTWTDPDPSGARRAHLTVADPDDRGFADEYTLVETSALEESGVQVLIIRKADDGRD